MRLQGKCSQVEDVLFLGLLSGYELCIKDELVEVRSRLIADLAEHCVV